MSLRVIAEVSVIVVATAASIAAVALVLTIAQLRRTMARAGSLLALAVAGLPALARELSLFATKLDQTTNALAALADTVERIDGCMEAVGRATRQGRNRTRPKIRRAAITLAADAAGAIRMSREALRWIRIPRRCRTDGRPAVRPRAKEDDRYGDALWMGDG